MVKIESPLPGIVAKVWVKHGDEVKEGDPIVTLQIMKTEHPIPSPLSGKVNEIFVKEGEEVEQGAPLVEIQE